MASSSPVLGYTLEEFERLLSAGGDARPAASHAPSYRLDRVAARGSVKSERADLSIQFTVFVDDKDWVRVPLRLSSTVVHGPVKYAGPGEYFLEFDDASDEYVAWFRGASDKPHQLTLDVLVPVTTLAGETRLKLEHAARVQLRAGAESSRAEGRRPGFDRRGPRIGEYRRR